MTNFKFRNGISFDKSKINPKTNRYKGSVHPAIHEEVIQKNDEHLSQYVRYGLLKIKDSFKDMSNFSGVDIVRIDRYARELSKITYHDGYNCSPNKLVDALKSLKMVLETMQENRSKFEGRNQIDREIYGRVLKDLKRLYGNSVFDVVVIRDFLRANVDIARGEFKNDFRNDFRNIVRRRYQRFMDSGFFRKYGAYQEIFTKYFGRFGDGMSYDSRVNQMRNTFYTDVEFSDIRKLYNLSHLDDHEGLSKRFEDMVSKIEWEPFYEKHKK